MFHADWQGIRISASQSQLIGMVIFILASLGIGCCLTPVAFKWTITGDPMTGPQDFFLTRIQGFLPEISGLEMGLVEGAICILFLVPIS